MPSADKRALDQCTVLITRPRHQAGELQRRLEQQGAKVRHFPVIEIGAVAENAVINRILAKLDEYDIAIFISRNAVEQANILVKRSRGSWPKQLKLAAIGSATADMLVQSGLHVDIQPDAQFDTEGLLTSPAMQQLNGHRIVIFRGMGGREKLAEELRLKGAAVDYAEVYYRRRPQIDFEQLSEDQRKEISAIIVASNESLQNLYEIAGDKYRSWLLNRPLVVISQRCGALANKLKFSRYCVANQASMAGLAEAVVECCKQYPVEERDD